MRSAVIVSTARTPIGRAYRGAFNNTTPQALAGHAIEHAVKRAGIDGGEVEDVVFGAALQQGLGPTGNAYQLQLELMELDLNPVRKNLELAEARLRKLKHRSPGDGAATDEELSEAEEKCLAQMRTFRDRWKSLKLARSVVAEINATQARAARRRRAA